MSGDDSIDRRSFVASALAASLFGTSLAGCTGSGSGGGAGSDGGDASDGSSGDDGSDGSSGGASDGSSGGASDGSSGGASDGSGGGDGTERFGGWMAGVANYDGVVDETGAGEVAITVGATGNGGSFAFEPAAVRVSTGTTVVWEWNGKGGSHNVAAVDGGDFESDLTDEEGHTFEQTFEDSGTVTYQCTPHASLGMKGAVVVE